MYGWVDGPKEGHMITKISRIYRLPFFLTQDRLIIIIIIIIMIILIIMINNSISVKISRLQNGRFFPQKLVCMARSASVIISREARGPT